MKQAIPTKRWTANFQDEGGTPHSTEITAGLSWSRERLEQAAKERAQVLTVLGVFPPNCRFVSIEPARDEKPAGESAALPS